MIFGFGKNKKKLRLVDASRIAIEDIIEGTGLEETDGFWENSYVCGFLYALSLEAIKFENNDIWDEDCLEAWTDYWSINYKYIWAMIKHFSSMEADEEIDKEVPNNQKIISEFNKGAKFGRTALLIRTGRHSSIIEGVQMAIDLTENLIEEGTAPIGLNKEQYNIMVGMSFTKLYLMDYRIKADNFEI
jgi:hypothetical protein